jgi:hypothetical protein
MSCRRKLEHGKSLDLGLWTHIKFNVPNQMHLVSTLNVVEKWLIAPHLTFAQFFQLKGYGQYGLHGNIVNVPTNLDLVESILPRMPHNDFTTVYFKTKNKIQINSYVKLCSTKYYN